MALISVDLKTTFQFDLSPKTFKFEDTTDYAAQGVGLSEVTGVLKVIDPAGNTHYNNLDHTDPDIDPDVSRIGVKTISLPLLADGSVMQGQYTITYTVRVAATTIDPAYDISVEKKLTLVYVSPEIDLTLTSDCVTPLLKSVDGTTYLVNSVDPTIVRDHKIIYPASLNKADVTGIGATLETNVFYTIANSTLQHSSSLTSTLTYIYAVDFIVTDSITGNTYNDVACDAQLCDIYCCLRAEWNRYEDYKNTNKRLADKHLANWHQMIGLSEKIRIALECGKGDHISGYLATIQNLGNCEAGCGCDDGVPTLVTGLGGGGTVIVESAGTPIEVTSSISGTTTTYFVKLADATVTKINNLYNSIVTAGSGVTITPTVAPNGDISYKVDFTDASVEPDILSFKVDLDFTTSSPPVITISNVANYGSAFKAPTITNANTVQADWLAKNNCFTLKTFWLLQGAKNYKAHIEILQQTWGPIKGWSGGVDCGFGRSIEVQIMINDNAELQFRFCDPDGFPISGNVLNFYTNFKLAITLIA